MRKTKVRIFMGLGLKIKRGGWEQTEQEPSDTKGNSPPADLCTATPQKATPDRFSPHLLLVTSDGVKYGWNQLCWLCSIPVSSPGGLHEKQKSP